MPTVKNTDGHVAPEPDGLFIAVLTSGEMFAVAHVSDLAQIPVGHLAALCLTGEAASMARADVLAGRPVLAALRGEWNRGAAPALATNQTMHELLAAEEELP